eukprot:3937286-Pyramimonas_sp.AAC.1
MSERIWIDDLAQRTVASRVQVRRDLIETITDTAAEFQNVSLSIAAKSVVTCSSHADAKAVVR